MVRVPSLMALGPGTSWPPMPMGDEDIFLGFPRNI